MLKQLIILILIGAVTLSNAKQNSKIKEAFSAIKHFEKVWKAKLTRELKKDGIGVEAIKFCSVDAIKFTKKIADQYKNITLRRTSLKNRNPNNAPDSIDIPILKSFNKMAKMKKEPTTRIITTKDGYRIYAPLIVKTPICLKCHGTKRNRHKYVKKILEKKYPNDKAVNFKYKHVRGAVVATVTN